MKILQALKITGILEGISFLFMLGIAMPVKKIYDMPSIVTYTGWAHGLLFMLFVGLAGLVMLQRKKGILWFGGAFISAFLPFGTFVWDKKVLSKEFQEE